MGLFIMKGAQVLEQADVVVYDSSGQGILTRIPASAKLINVGKRQATILCPRRRLTRVLLMRQKGQLGSTSERHDPFLLDEEERNWSHKGGHSL